MGIFHLAARKRCLDLAYLHYWLWHYRNLTLSLRLFNSVLRQRRTYEMALALWSLNCLTGMNACQQPQNLYNLWSSTVTNFRLVMQQSRPGWNAAKKQPDDSEASGHSAVVVQIISTIYNSWLSMLKFKVLSTWNCIRISEAVATRPEERLRLGDDGLQEGRCATGSAPPTRSAPPAHIIDLYLQFYGVSCKRCGAVSTSSLYKPLPGYWEPKWKLSS
jgi:hypothetical protein